MSVSRKVLCFAIVAAQMMGSAAIRAEDLSPQKAATGVGRSITPVAPKAGNASGGESQQEEQPAPYIPPAHGLAQALILGTVTAGAAAAAILAASKQNETSSTSTTTGTQ